MLRDIIRYHTIHNIPHAHGILDTFYMLRAFAIFVTDIHRRYNKHAPIWRNCKIILRAHARNDTLTWMEQLRGKKHMRVIYRNLYELGLHAPLKWYLQRIGCGDSFRNLEFCLSIRDICSDMHTARIILKMPYKKYIYSPVVFDFVRRAKTTEIRWLLHTFRTTDNTELKNAIRHNMRLLIKTVVKHKQPELCIEFINTMKNTSDMCVTLVIHYVCQYGRLDILRILKPQVGVTSDFKPKVGVTSDFKPKVGVTSDFKPQIDWNIEGLGAMNQAILHNQSRILRELLRTKPSCPMRGILQLYEIASQLGHWRCVRLLNREYLRIL